MPIPSKCFIGFCSLDLLVENSQSLKDKRRVVASLKEKLRNRFNIAVCEYGDLSLWQRSQLGFVACGNEQKLISSIIRAVTEFVDQNPSVTLLNATSEILEPNS